MSVPGTSSGRGAAAAGAAGSSYLRNTHVSLVSVSQRAPHMEDDELVKQDGR